VPEPHFFVSGGGVKFPVVPDQAVRAVQRRISHLGPAPAAKPMNMPTMAPVPAPKIAGTTASPQGGFDGKSRMYPRRLPAEAQAAASAACNRLARISANTVHMVSVRVTNPASAAGWPALLGVSFQVCRLWRLPEKSPQVLSLPSLAFFSQDGTIATVFFGSDPI
jgi:hypothetical protein